MKKITDKFWLGFVSGLGGNIAKNAVELVFKKRGVIKRSAVDKAAGIFLAKKDITTPAGKAVGFIADNMIAAMLGVACVYMLAFMGKDKYALKGATLGSLEWTAMYGVMSRMGATTIFPVTPSEALVGFLSHLAFGATKITIAVTLGDKRLFKPVNLTKKIKNPQELRLQDLPAPISER